MGSAVVFGEGHMDRPAFAQRHAFDLLLKAWQQAPGTEHSVNVFCRAPRKRLAINFAAKAYCDLVALCGRSLAFLGQEGAVNLGKPRDRLLDLQLWAFTSGTSTLSRSISISAKLPISISGKTSRATVKDKSDSAAKTFSISSRSLGKSILGSKATRSSFSSTILRLASLIAS